MKCAESCNRFDPCWAAGLGGCKSSLHLRGRWSFPGGTSGQELPCQCKRRKSRFDFWVGKLPRRRTWQPTPAFLPGESSWTEEPGGLQSMGSRGLGTAEVTEPVGVGMLFQGPRLSLGGWARVGPVPAAGLRVPLLLPFWHASTPSIAFLQLAWGGGGGGSRFFSPLSS